MVLFLAPRELCRFSFLAVYRRKLEGFSSSLYCPMNTIGYKKIYILWITMVDGEVKAGHKKWKIANTVIFFLIHGKLPISVIKLIAQVKFSSYGTWFRSANIENISGISWTVYSVFFTPELEGRYEQELKKHPTKQQQCREIDLLMSKWRIELISDLACTSGVSVERWLNSFCV